MNDPYATPPQLQGHFPPPIQTQALPLRGNYPGPLPHSPFHPPMWRDTCFPIPSPTAQVHTPSPLATMSLATPVKRQHQDDQPGSSSAASGQNRKSSVERGEGAGKKKRVSLSCAQCAKRKQKCNREFPCQHCLARKVPELCVPYNPQSSSSSTGPDSRTANRLDLIESVLSVVVRHTTGITSYEAVKEWMSTPQFQQIVSETSSATSSPRFYEKPVVGHSSRPSSSGHATQQPEAQQLDSMRSASLEDDGIGKGGIDKDWLPELDGGMPENMGGISKAHLKLDIHGTPAENFQKMSTEFGVSPHKVQEIVQELPPKPFADRVINWFFSKLNYIRYPIDERLFRTAYEDVYAKLPSVDPSHCRVLPLVFIVLAMAVRLAPEPWAGDEQHKKLSSLRMYWTSRRSVLLATAIQPESIELVVTRLLSAMYLVLMHDRRLTECWSQLGASLRTAQAIGLHRDGTKLGLDPFQTEYRRRLWSYLYHADKLYSLILGRPPSISDAYTDALPPSNVEMSELDASMDPSKPPPEAKPLSQPTTATFLILRRDLASIVGRIVHHFQKLHEPAQYGDVEKLQHELDQFVERLPPHFRMHEPDKSLDQEHWWLPVHRFLLLTEVLVTTILLHRPWLLRKLSSNRYAASRTACFEAAKLDFRIRQDFRREVPEHRLFAVASQFKMFNSAMIAGISAIIDPRGPDSDEMRRILAAFLEQNPWHEVVGMDETTRKEVQIIHTLSKRAAKIFEDSFPPGETSRGDSDSAALLLALRQAGDNTASTPVMGPPQMPPDFHPPLVPPPSRPRKSRSSNHPPAPPSLQAMPGPLHMGGIIQSPASSLGGHEDDHSQRLLDHWLLTNSALPASSMTPLGFENGGYLPMPSVPMGMGIGALPMQPSTPLGGAPAYPDPGMAFGGWTGTPMTQPDYTQGYQMALDSQLAPTLPLGVGGDGLEGNSDEYWNALIDGILGTTGTVPTPAS